MALTAAGTVLLEAGRDVLAAVDHAVSQTRQAAGLGWLTASPDTLPAPLDAMSLGQFEPEVWIDPHFAFTDPPLRHSLPVALAFAATADPPAAVLTGPGAIADVPPAPADPVRHRRQRDPASTGIPAPR